LLNASFYKKFKIQTVTRSKEELANPIKFKTLNIKGGYMINCNRWFLILLFIGFQIYASGFATEQSTRERHSKIIKPIPPATQLLSTSPENIMLLPFFDNFESGVSSWTLDGQFNLITNAQNYSVLNPGINPTLVTLPDNGHLPSAFSGNHMCWFGETATGTFIGAGWDTIYQEPKNGGTSAEPQMGSFISPAIDLTGVSHAQFSFKTWWEIEGVDVDFYDLMQIEISTDNGVSFQPIGRGAINPLNDVDGESWKPYSSGGLGEPGVWLNQLFDLSPWVGNMIHLRFRFDTVDALYNGFRGWFIDDVSVTSDPLPAPDITSVVPSLAYGGEIVNINGNNFINGAIIDIGGSVVSAVISTNLAQIEAPYLPAGTYDVTITNPDGQSDTEVNGLTITDVNPPLITYIDPDSAEVGTSVPVTISGDYFEAGTMVDIGGAALLNQTVVNYFTITGNSPNTLPVGNHRVTVTNPDGQYDRLILGFRVYGTTAIDDPGQSEIAGGFSLQQNYPNPFNPTTRIDFTIPVTGLVQLKVFNLVGQEVATIISEVLSAGSHSVQFSGENLNSGVYFYQLKAGKQSEMKKFILMK
jgi:hypothetical protein